MAYTPTVWVNGQPPALNAENLNNMENGIKKTSDITTKYIGDKQLLSENAEWLNGYNVTASVIYPDNSTLVESANTASINKLINCNGLSDIEVKCDSTYKHRLIFFETTADDKRFIDGTIRKGYPVAPIDISPDRSTWNENETRTITVPNSVKSFTISLRRKDGAVMTDNEWENAITVTTGTINPIFNNEYKGKVVSILGDSISTFGGSASDDPAARISDGTYTYAGNRCRYPQSNLLLNVNDTYWYSLLNALEMRLGINESWAGSRVSWDGTTESADIGANKHIASATRIGHLGENGTPDIILINAGTNDIGGAVPLGTFNYDSPRNYTPEQIAALPVNTFADAYRTMLIRVQKLYPNSRIIVLLPNYTTSYYTPQKADQYCEIIKEACDYFGIKWKDMRASGITMFNNDTYMPDGIHYNAAGMKIVEKNVEKFMKYDFTV